MAKASAKKFKIIHDPELLRVARMFVPTFGSESDLHLVNRILELDKLLATVDNEVLRSPGKKGLTKKMQDILREERIIIHAITSRNMDF